MMKVLEETVAELVQHKDLMHLESEKKKISNQIVKYNQKFRLMKRVGTVVNVEYGVDLNKLKISDAGNITPTLQLEEAHLKLRDKVASLLQEGTNKKID